MLIFVGWSGPESKSVATALAKWLKMVCNAIEPWFSPLIEKGKRWNPEISKRLHDSRAGVFVLTPDNLDSAWLHFEAGAISNVPGARVCTFLRRIPGTAVKEPLSTFQDTKSDDMDDTLEMVRTLWRQLPDEEKHLGEKDLDRAFERWWPDLAKQLDGIKPPEGGAVIERPSADKMLEEILSLARDIDRRDRSKEPGSFSWKIAQAIQPALTGHVVSPLSLGEPSEGFSQTFAENILAHSPLKNLGSDPALTGGQVPSFLDIVKPESLDPVEEYPRARAATEKRTAGARRNRAPKRKRAPKKG